MLAGTVTFYDKEGACIQSMDIERYEMMSRAVRDAYIDQHQVGTITLTSYTHNHDMGVTRPLYEEGQYIHYSDVEQ